MNRRESRDGGRAGNRPFPAQRVAILGVQLGCVVGTSSISAGQMLIEVDVGWGGMGETMQNLRT